MIGKKKEIIEKLKNKDEKELFQEIQKFTDEELSNIKERVSPDEIIDLFLEKIGLDTFLLKTEDPLLNFKLHKIKILLRSNVLSKSSNKLFKDQIDELLNLSEEELIEELVTFIREKFPNWSMDYRNALPSSITQIFWSNKGLPAISEFDLERSCPEAHLKIKGVENLAYRKLIGLKELPQIPEELLNKSSDEIISELSNFVNKKIDDYIVRYRPGGFYHLLTQTEQEINEYYKTINLDLNNMRVLVNLLPYRTRPETYEGKLKEFINKIYNARIAIAEDMRMRLPKIVEEKRKKLLEELTPRIIKWLNEKGLSKITKDYVKLFLIEENVTIPGSRNDFIDTFYSSVNLKMRSPFSQKIDK